MEPRTEEQDYAAWVQTVRVCHTAGWKHLDGGYRWVFQSPKGTLHDLSAADLGQLKRIESDGLFLVE